MLKAVYYYCRLKANIVLTFLGRKINLSGISPANAADPDQIRYMWTDQRYVTTFREFGRDQPILAKMGAGTSHAEPKFFCLVNQLHATFRELRNHADFHQIWLQNVGRCPVEESGKTFAKLFTFVVICPKNLTSKFGRTGTSEHATERFCLLHDVQGPASEFPKSCQLLCTTYVRLRGYGRQSCPIFGFWPIFPIQNP